MTDAEIKALASTAMQQLDRLGNDRDSLKRMVQAYARQNEKLRVENDKLQKLLDVEREVTHNLTDPDRYI
jgi:regulator of replication initiation timing